MMTFDETKTKLKSLFEELGFVLVDEHKRELYYKLNKSNSTMILVPEAEIEEFQTVSDVFPSIKVSPVETSIIGVNFREQLVDYAGTSRGSIGFFREKSIKFGDQESHGISVVTGTASPVFYNFFRFQKERSSLFLSRANRTVFFAPRMSMRDILPRLLTIKIEYLEAKDEKSLNNVTGMFESCLFELSYMTNTHIELRNEWPSFRARKRVITSRRASAKSPHYLFET